MRYVSAFAQSPDDPFRVGARGVSFREMALMGLPIPPGFAIDAVACRRFLETGDLPDEMWQQTSEAVSGLGTETPERPLILAVRASPPVPMPGLMDTVLDIGVTETSMAHLAAWESPTFAAEIRARFLAGYAATVRRVPPQRLHPIAAEVTASLDQNGRPGVAALETAIGAYRDLIAEETQRPVPDTLEGQLREAIEAVFASWDRAPARRYRRSHDISDDLGSAAVVHLMAFGTVTSAGGSGVAFSRDPVSGAPGSGGVYEPGTARPASQLLYPGLGGLREAMPGVCDQLESSLNRLERSRRHVIRVDFVCERGELFLLEARRANQEPAGTVRSAVDMVDEGLISEEVAIMQIDPEGLDRVLHPHLGPIRRPDPIAEGAAAAPGAATGPIAFDSPSAITAAAAGTPAILVLRDAGPDDVDGVTAAAGVLTTHGGRTSHGVVAARGLGIPVVTGVAGISLDGDAGTMRIDDRTFTAGDAVTIDGASGTVYAGSLDVRPAAVSPELDRLLTWADDARTLGVWANADTPDTAVAARRAGAEGIGLARTEYMFGGERLAVVRTILISEDARERAAALEDLEALQVGDFVRLLETMDGMPVVVRLLDPPLHEFLPDRLDVDHALTSARTSGEPTDQLEALSSAIDRFDESNPMLGLRGVRLAVVIPEIYRVQVLAALEAVRRRLDAGGDPRLDLVIPLVAVPDELHLIRDMIEEEVHYAGRQLEIGIGTLIELPRAALIAGDLALASDFFSFGTNDLTQTTLGISRDDAEEDFLRSYLEQGVLRRNPFTTIDPAGVGRLIELAISEGRTVNPGLEIGVCGEHGGDPTSIAFFHGAGVDYVSCSPPRVPIARLAAAQAALRNGAAQR